MGSDYDGGPALTQYWLDDSFPKRGEGTVMSHSKGACPKGGGGAPPITAKGRGWGGGQIMLMCPQSVSYTTGNYNFLLSCDKLLHI